MLVAAINSQEKIRKFQDRPVAQSPRDYRTCEPKLMLQSDWLALFPVVFVKLFLRLCQEYDLYLRRFLLAVLKSSFYLNNRGHFFLASTTRPME